MRFLPIFYFSFDRQVSPVFMSNPFTTFFSLLAVLYCNSLNGLKKINDGIENRYGAEGVGENRRGSRAPLWNFRVLLFC